MRLLIFIPLFFTLFATAQPKGATTVIVKNVSLQQVADAILTKGYTVDKYHPEIGTLTTGEKSFDTFLLSINARVKDSTLYLTGRAKVLISIFSKESVILDPVINKGTKGSPYKVSFNELVEIAQSLGKEITYAESNL